MISLYMKKKNFFKLLIIKETNKEKKNFFFFINILFLLTLFNKNTILSFDIKYTCLFKGTLYKVDTLEIV